MTDTRPTTPILEARLEARSFADAALLVHYNRESSYHIRDALAELAALEAAIPAARAALEAMQRPTYDAAARRLTGVTT